MASITQQPHSEETQKEFILCTCLICRAKYLDTNFTAICQLCGENKFG